MQQTNSVVQIPVFSSSDSLKIAKDIRGFCLKHTKPGTDHSNYSITLKLWTSLEKGILNSRDGTVQTNVPVLNATVQPPGTTAPRNPGIFYREMTLDKIENEIGLKTVLEEYR
jgi:hypothetical protein